MTEWKQAGCHGNAAAAAAGASCTHTVCTSHRGRTTFSHLPLGSWLRNPDPDEMLMKPAGLVLDSGSEQGRGGGGEEEGWAVLSEAASAFRPSHPEASCWLVYTQPEPSRARPPPCPRCSVRPRRVFPAIILRSYPGGAPCAPGQSRCSGRLLSQHVAQTPSR